MTLADKLIKHAANVHLPDGLAMDLLAAAEALKGAAEMQERCAQVCEQHGTGGFSYAAAIRALK